VNVSIIAFPEREIIVLCDLSDVQRLQVGYVLLDGCADRPSPKLNFTTPLEAAYTPNLDRIAERSALGRVITVKRGTSPESDVAVFSMLGYTFPDGYPGRGVIEAIGAGVTFNDGDVALRANFASVKNGRIIDRRAGRNITQEEAKGLEEELRGVTSPEAEFDFRATISHRGVLVIRSSKPISRRATNTDPAYARIGGIGTAEETSASARVRASRPEESDGAAKRTARLINEFTRRASEVLVGSEVNKERVRMGKLPANAVLLRDASDRLPRVERFEKRYGRKGVALVEMPAEVGIARLLGMKLVRVQDRDNLSNQAIRFERELGEGVVVYAHIKGPDEFGHDGDMIGKRNCIERIDHHFFSPLADRTGDTKLAISCDHATPCILRRHSADPVPILITGGKGGGRFTEKDARRGSLGTLQGPEVLRKVLAP